MIRNLMTTIARLSDHMILCASMDYGSGFDRYKQLAKETINNLDYNSPQRCIIEAGEFSFYYQISDNIVYITLAEKSYPKKLAFEYLLEVSQEFHEDYGRAINTFTRPYSAVSFDSSMEKVRTKFIDPNAGHHALKRLNANLLDIQGIMHKNIQDAIGRGESLDRIENKTSQLLLDSQAFKEQARYTNFMAMIKQYAPLVAIAVVVIFVLIYYFLF